MLTDIARCWSVPCLPGRRLYAAISPALCLAGLSATSGSGAGAYVFKVGHTEGTCDGRKHTLNQKLVPGRRPPRGFGRSLPYAGVQDWEPHGCWFVARDDYDNVHFRPWLKHVPAVNAVDPYDCAWVPNLGTAVATELYAMFPAFLSADVEAVKPHHVHKDLLRVVREAFLSMVRAGKLPSAVAARGPA